MRAYEGTENYIFVSYAHKDSAIVVPIIESLQQGGFRVWYDSGIEAGTEWPAYIEEHLQKCAAVLVFISPASVASVNCRNEINLACMIHKKMLIAYLQDTELAHGMLLQLSALQSIYRNRHQSLSSFLEELHRSQILQCCKAGYCEDGVPASEQSTFAPPPTAAMDMETVLRSGDMEMIKESRRNAPPLISKVGSMGATNTDTVWPVGTYSPVIDIDRYNVVYFHSRFMKGFGKEGEYQIGLLIFNSEGLLVHQDLSPIVFRKEYDRVSQSWIVRDAYGMAQDPGLYTALIWVDDSRIYEYKFRLQSKNETVLKETKAEETVEDPCLKDLRELEKKEQKELTAKLAYPKIFLSTLITLLSFFFGVSVSGITATLMLAFFIVSLIFVIRSYRLVKTYLIKSKLLSAFVVSLGNIYFTVVIFVMMLTTLGKRKEWKARLQELKSREGT